MTVGTVEIYQNSGYLGTGAIRNCRMCLAEGPERGDLDFDIIRHGWFYHIAGTIQETTANDHSL